MLPRTLRPPPSQREVEALQSLKHFLTPKRAVQRATAETFRGSRPTALTRNIAEGYGRQNQKEYLRFLRIALGSARELNTQLIISLRVELTKSNYIESVLKDSDEIQRLLVTTISKVSN